MRFAPLLALLFLLSLGCKGDTTANAATGSTGADIPEKASLYEQVRAGAYQLSQAQDAISEALLASQGMPAMGGAKQDILDIFDGVGEGLSKYSGEPPPEADFAKDEANEAKRRLAAIDAANDAIQDLMEAKDVVAAASEEADANLKEKLETLDGLVDVAVEALRSAVEAYGGKLEVPVEQQPEESIQ